MNLIDVEHKMQGHRPRIMETRKQHAVLLPLIETEEGLCFVFEKRAATIFQGGELCFPGGGIEDGETAAEAAIREFEEELGISRSCFEKFYGEYNVLVTYGHLNIYTFVALLKPDSLQQMNPSPAEVEKPVVIPLSYLEENPPRIFEFPIKPAPSDEEAAEFMAYTDIDPASYSWRKGSLTIPVWKYKGEQLWGITARIVRDFLGNKKEE